MIRRYRDFRLYAPAPDRVCRFVGRQAPFVEWQKFAECYRCSRALQGRGLI